MRTYDLTPLFRSTIGFDNLSRLIDSAMKLDEAVPAYPPYNIEKIDDDSYRITMAVAGFSENELSLVTQDNVLLVTGKQTGDDAQVERQYLHRGIAARAFERRFQLADHVKVTGASLKDGLLHVDLVREVPEAKKPRAIKIENGSGGKAAVIDQKTNDQKLNA
jgi:molecular chaperone IbpA